jgi:transposase
MIWIGIDAHKRVHQAVALSVDGVLSQRVIANTPAGWTELRQPVPSGSIAWRDLDKQLALARKLIVDLTLPPSARPSVANSG